jgi:hypothetical protein
MEQLDRDSRVGPRLANKLVDAGFSHVQSQVFNIPIGTWPTGKLAFIVVALEVHCRVRVCPRSVLMDIQRDSSPYDMSMFSGIRPAPLWSSLMPTIDGVEESKALCMK